MSLYRHGKRVSRLVLHGGGSSSFGVYMGLFDTLGLGVSNIGFELVTSSAGSMAFFALLVKHIQGGRMNEAMIHDQYQRMRASCSLWNLLEMQGPAFFDQAYVRRMINDLCVADGGEEAMTLTFRSLGARLPGLDVSVLACHERSDGRWRTRSFNRTDTPDVLVWQACVASMSIPIIFEPQVINGRKYMDADLMNYSGAYADAHTVQIGPLRMHTHVCKLLSSLSTQVPLIDRLCEFFVKIVRNRFEGPSVANIVRHGFCSNILRSPFDPEFVAAGRTLAQEFVLKSSEAERSTAAHEAGEGGDEERTAASPPVHRTQEKTPSP